MATLWVYTCNGTRAEYQGFGQPSGSETPACQGGSQGEWVQLSYVTPEDDRNLFGYEIPEAQIGPLFSAIALLLAAAYAIKLVLDVMRGKR